MAHDQRGHGGTNAQVELGEPRTGLSGHRLGDAECGTRVGLAVHVTRPVGELHGSAELAERVVHETAMAEHDADGLARDRQFRRVGARAQDVLGLLHGRLRLGDSQREQIADEKVYLVGPHRLFLPVPWSTTFTLGAVTEVSLNGGAMARVDTEAWEATNRQRLDDQVEMVRRDNAAGVTVRSSRGEEDLTILTVPNTVIVEGDGRDEKLEALRSLLDGPKSPFAKGGKPFEERLQKVIDDVAVVELPRLKGKRGEKEDAADVVLEELPGVGRPEYYVHVSADHGRPCPATEPEETGSRDPWPPYDTASDRR